MGKILVYSERTLQQGMNGVFVHILVFLSRAIDDL